jgi:hypothetical protein
MLYRSRILLLLFSALVFLHPWSAVAADDSSQGKWRITSVKVCKGYRGAINPHIVVSGSFPVYSFFIPRPVWTVNGIVVEAQPLYERGGLTGFRLLGAAPVLRTGAKNTIKLSLPDQNAAKIFRYDSRKPPPGDCYEFF